MKSLINNLLTRRSIFILFFILFSTKAFSANETFTTGSFIINMGVVPQTINNGLKPYGLIYDLMRTHNVPIKWIISQTKLKDGTDFTYNGTAYKGGTFIIPAEYRSAAVNATIANWTGQGVVGTTTTSPLTVNVTYTLNGIPRWTINSVNGSIGEAFLLNAGINNTTFPGAYNYKPVENLDNCDDMFVMPHADPTWSTHSRLYTWNKQFLGSIWSGCHAASALENSINPANPSQQMNFLTERTSATTPTPWPNNSLTLWNNHSAGTPPYINQYPNDPLSQYMGTVDAAQQNGSEQIFMPIQNSAARWRSGTKLMVYDPTQVDVPNLLPNLSNAAATVVYGHGFDSTNRGYVMYEAGHNVGGTSAAQVAAVRIFFNFSFFQMIPKAPQLSVAGITGNDTIVNGGSTIFGLQATATGALPGTTFTYQWESTCGGGSFSAPTANITNFTTPVVSVITHCVLSCKVVDNCGRTSFASYPITIVPPPLPPHAVNDTVNIASGCNPTAVTLNVLANDTDPQGASISFDSLITSTMNPTDAGVWASTPNGIVSFTPFPNFAGTATIQYSIHNSLGATSTATIFINDGTPDVNGCFPNSVYAPQDIQFLDLTSNFVSTTGTGAVLNGTAFDDAEDTYTTAADDYLNFGTTSTNNLILSVGASLRYKDSINIYWSKGTAGSAATLSVQIGQSAAGPWTNTQTFTIPASPSGTGATVSTVSKYALPSGTNGITHIRVSPGIPSPATNSGAQVWVDAVEYEYLNCVLKTPNASDDATTLLEDVPTVINVLENDADPQGLALTVKQITSGPHIGKVSINPDGTITYVNNTDVSGIDSFSYQVCNAENRCTEATVRVTINDDGCSAGTYKPISGGSSVTKIFQYQYAGANAATANSTAANFRDSYLDQASGGNDNKGGNTKIEIGKAFSSTAARRGVLYFNTSEIPSGSVVQSASVSLLRVGGDGNTQTIGLYGLNAGFVENQTTWLQRSTGNNWSSAGGAFGSLVSSVSVSSSNIRSAWEINSLAQSWISNSANNFGLLLKTGETLNKRHQFASKEDGTSSKRPILTVTYVVPTSCSAISNRAPFANPDLATTTSTIPVTVSVLGNDTDPDGNSISLISVFGSTHGTAVVNGSNVVFTPTSGYNGLATVSYRIKDATLYDTAIVYINVTNSAPVAVNDFPSGALSGAAQTINAGTNDYDPEGAALSFTLINYHSITANGSNGTASISGSNVTYTPNTGFTGTDTIYYEITEASSGCSEGLKDTAYIVFTVLNQPPTANNIPRAGIPCQNYMIDLLQNASDPEGDQLTPTNISPLSPLSSGTLVNNNDGTVTFIPASGFTGTASFSFTVTDNGVPALTSNPASVVTINIALAPNLGPSAVNDFANSINSDEILYYPVLDNDSDPENNVLSLPVITVQALHGVASVLPNGLIKYEPKPGFAGTDQVTYQICDSVYDATCILTQGLCSSAIMYIEVKAPNTVVAINDQNTTWMNMAVSGGVMTNDFDPEGNNPLTFRGFIVDGINYTSGTINVSGVNSQGNAVAFAGTLTINTDGTYLFTPANGFTGSVSVQYAIQDAYVIPATDMATLTIAVLLLPNTNENSIVANNDEIVIYGGTVNGSVVVNDADPQGDPFTVTSFLYDSDGDGIPDAGASVGSAIIVGGLTVNGVPVANAGTLTLNADGSYTFITTVDFNGSVDILYTICDNVLPQACASAILHIDVLPDLNGPANNPPFAGDDFGYTNQSTSVTLNFIHNDNDPDGNPLSLNGVVINTAGPATPIGAPVTTVNGGSIQFFANGTLTYTPPQGYTGPDHLVYTICDVTAVAPQPLCAHATVYLIPANSPPVANNDNATTNEDTPVTFNITNNDVDADGTINTNSVDLDPLTIGQQTTLTTAQGSWSVNPSGNVTFTPVGNYNGTTSITYTVNDNSNIGSNVAMITVVVLPVNDPPVVPDSTVTTPEDTPITICLPVSDVDGISIIPSSCDGPSHGTINGWTVQGNNVCVTYTPAPNYNGPDGLCVLVCDGGTPNQCDTAHVTIIVTPVNDPPVVPDSTVTTPEDTPITICLPVSDVDGISIIPSSCDGPSHGTINGWTVQGNTVCVTYTPAPNYNGPDGLCVLVCDGGTPNRCDTAHVTIIVTPVNDPPVVPDSTVTTPEDTPITICLPVSDVDGISIIPSSCDGPSHGTINGWTVQGNTVCVTYTPAPNYNGPDGLCVLVCDGGTPNRCDTAHVTIIVTPVNDPPVVPDSTVTTPEDTPITICLPVSDVDGISIIPSSCDGPSHGTINGWTVQGNNVCVTYTPAPNYNGPDGLCVLVCDGGTPNQCDTAHVTIIVTPVNDPPVVPDSTVTTPEDTPITICLPVSDVDGISIIPSSCDGPSHGTINGWTVQGNTVCVTYTPAPNYNGPDGLCVLVCDGGTPNRCDTAHVTIIVTPVNDPPVVPDSTVTTPEDTPITICLPVSDVDGISIIPSPCGGPSHGTINAWTVQGNTICVTYTPASNYNGPDELCVLVCDGGTPNRCDTAHVNITVTPSNDDPVANNDYANTNQDSPVTFNITNNDTDPDGTINTNSVDLDPLTIGQQTTLITASGTWSVNAAGNLTFTPVSGFSGITTITYLVKDNNGNSSNVATIKVNVTAIRTACDTYTWNGSTYTNSGVYTYTSLNAAGCTNTATLNLTINYSTTDGNATVTACDTYTWNGSTYTNSGMYTYTSLNAAGCTNTATLNLTVNYSTTDGNATVTACDMYTWNGATYTNSGVYTYTSLNAAGCLNTAVLNLTVNYSSSNGGSTTTQCNSYTWNGTTYTATGTYTYTTLNASGCLNTATLNLTIKYATSSITNITACNSYTWTNGVTYSSAGTYSYTTLNASGCDSVLTLNLTLNNGVSISVKAMLDAAYDASTGLMKDSLRRVSQCPSAQIGVPGVCPPVNVIPGTRLNWFNSISCPNDADTSIGGGNATIADNIMSVSGANAIVDWVFVEVRDGANYNNVIATKYALIQRDGDIVSCVDGSSSLYFPCVCPGNYYISVKHRNHLGIMTGTSLTLGASTTSFNFADPAANVWVKPGYPTTITNTPRRTVGGVANMWGGDANTNKNAKYNGLSNDKEQILYDFGAANSNEILYQVYKNSDLNMDGKVKYNNTDNDKNWLLNLILVSASPSTPNTIISQHTPN